MVDQLLTSKAGLGKVIQSQIGYYLLSFFQKGFQLIRPRELGA